MKFNGICLINHSIHIAGKVVNLYISYTQDPCSRHWKTGFILTKNVGPDKCKYSRYQIGVDYCSGFY